MVAGDSEQSHLIQLVLGREAGKRMPPDEADALTKAQIDNLRAWIDAGAPWPGEDVTATSSTNSLSHWSFQPIQDVQPPAIQSSWIQNPIDAFILEKLIDKKLEPNPPADRATLIRRLYLDMLGLPPTPEAIQAFVEDRSSRAVEDRIEEVLGSPHYGERWARYWLDLVRFAETNGFETNRERPNAWPYRDYVIRSLNEDKPYDQFLREQIAGDALGVPEATGFLVAGPYDLVKSPDINLTLMQRQNELDDIVGTCSTALLGLTVGCARCHNHKFDPISQTDYYAMQAIFAGVQHGDRAMPLTDAQKQQVAQIDQDIDLLEKRLQPFVRKNHPTRPAVVATGNDERFEAISAKLVRFTILATNGGEPCIDELEIFHQDSNVALSSLGTIATSSSSLPGYEIHKLEHIHDGQFGNAKSWISNENGAGWVQIEFPTIQTIDRIRWARDRNGQFGDRLAIRYRIEAATEPGRWTTIASSDDRIPYADGQAQKIEYDFDNLEEAMRQRGQDWLTELESLKKKKSQLLATSNVYAGTFQQPGTTHRLFRGEPMAKREPVAPNTISSLGQLEIDESTTEQQRRLALANWIASDKNPLTARVIVNRLWQFHFGKGLVSTPSDFGIAGVRPTHPELLDWLAQELIRHRWSLRHIHRLILSSATYQQSHRPRSDAMQIDAATEWWWRFPSRRLEAEPIRDSILAVTGSLDTTMHGPGFSAFEVELENVRHYFPKKSYGKEDWRRMIYMTKVRLEKESVFGIFDCPDAATSVPKRSRSTTPLQAFNLLNSTFVLQQSELFAARL